MIPGTWVEVTPEENQKQKTKDHDWRVGEYHAEAPIIGKDLIIEKVVLYRSRKRLLTDSN